MLKNLCLFTKSQNPAKELVADFYLCGDTEVGFIHFVILDILRAKAVNHGIQKRIDETNIYKPLLAAVHGENPLGVYFQVDLFEHFLAVPRLPCEANVLHNLTILLELDKMKTIQYPGRHALRILNPLARKGDF